MFRSPTVDVSPDNYEFFACPTGLYSGSVELLGATSEENKVHPCDTFTRGGTELCRVPHPVGPAIQSIIRGDVAAADFRTQPNRHTPHTRTHNLLVNADAPGGLQREAGGGARGPVGGRPGGPSGAVHLHAAALRERAGAAGAVHVRGGQLRRRLCRGSLASPY
jgi:hypothetical protein